MKAIATWVVKYKKTSGQGTAFTVGPFNSIDSANTVKMATPVPFGVWPVVVAASAKMIDDANVAAYHAIYGN